MTPTCSYRLPPDSHHAQATVKQFWPVMSRWAKGGAYIDAQLDVLAEILGAATATSMTQGTTISSSMSSAAAASASAVGGGVANGPVGLDANPLAGLAPQRLFVSMFKAAPHWILRNDWMARWVLQRSHATLHDETGLRPRAYNATGTLTDVAWQTRTFGAFIEFENREVKWCADLPQTLKQCTHTPCGLSAWSTLSSVHSAHHLIPGQPPRLSSMCTACAVGMQTRRQSSKLSSATRERCPFSLGTRSRWAATACCWQRGGARRPDVVRGWLRRAWGRVADAHPMAPPA